MGLVIVLLGVVDIMVGAFIYYMLSHTPVANPADGEELDVDFGFKIVVLLMVASGIALMGFGVQEFRLIQ